MVRVYLNGQVVGTIDPPVGTIKDWLTSELKLAGELVMDAENYGQLCGLFARKRALRETLYQLERRERHDNNAECDG